MLLQLQRSFKCKVGYKYQGVGYERELGKYNIEAEF